MSKKKPIYKPESDKISAVEDEQVEDNKKFSKRRIVNNWAKYERNIDEISSEQPDDRDFKFLERTTRSTNFFQLEEEKEWEKSRLNPEHSLFSLNIKQLTAGIACLPFYEILDIDKNLLAPESIDRCDKIAKNNVLRYRKDYPLCDQEKKIDKVQEKIISEVTTEQEPPKTEEDDELEDWLDSVLDN